MRVSGSIDVVLLGALIAAGSHVTGSSTGVALGIAVLVLGVAKVIYDHLTGFEDPLGIEGWAKR